MEKKDLVSKLLAARISSGKTYDELGEGLGLCNVYVAQLFHAQAHVCCPQNLQQILTSP